VSLTPQPQSSNRIRFGVFELEPESGVLRKRGVRIRLQEQPLRVLLALLEKPGEVVTREELQQKVWAGNEFGDFEHGLHIAVNKIREALGDSAGTPRFVETLPRRGYRFIAPVKGPVAPAAAPPGAPVTPVPAWKTKWISLAGAALVGLALIVGIAISLLPSSPQPKLQLRRLTNDNSPKFGPVLSDGARLYFRAGTERDSYVLQVPLSGGEPVRLPVVLPPARSLRLLDITPDGQELLLTASEPDLVDSDPLWTVRIGDGSSRRVGTLSAREARYSPDGTRIALATGGEHAGSLSVASSDGSNARRLLELKELSIVAPCWSPDGQRIAFGQFNQASQSGSTWEMMADGSRVRRLFPDWRETHLPAAWTPDGRLLLVSQGRFWTVPARRFFPFAPSLRFPISSGEPRFDSLQEGDWGGPSLIQARDSRSFYAVGTTPLGQLQRFDARRGSWEPHLGGISAEAVEYSRDGRSVAYVTYPEFELWVRRADGSRPVQLTKPPMQAWLPRWSPDGNLIAFDGKAAPDQPWRIYLVDAAGGTPRPGCPGDCGPQEDLTWAPDGRTIIYAIPTERYYSQDVYLRVLDLETGTVTKFPGSERLYSPRWSPDGSILAAVVWRKNSAPVQWLRLYRVSVGKWEEATNPDSGFPVWPSWSHDSKSIWYLNLDRRTVNRYDVRENRHEEVLPVKPEELAEAHPFWFNLTPDDKPMILRRHDIQQIYALDWKSR
jgi:Tol biopolymer transport system component/DNA-binding winged helix-turn-helix (wHTH) protein